MNIKNTNNGHSDDDATRSHNHYTHRSRIIQRYTYTFIVCFYEIFLSLYICMYIYMHTCLQMGESNECWPDFGWGRTSDAVGFRPDFGYGRVVLV